jgi:hypothetical protein
MFGNSPIERVRVRCCPLGLARLHSVCVHAAPQIKTETLTLAKPEKYAITGLGKWRKPSVNTMMEAKQNRISFEISKPVIEGDGKQEITARSGLTPAQHIVVCISYTTTCSGCLDTSSTVQRANGGYTVRPVNL